MYTKYGVWSIIYLKPVSISIVITRYLKSQKYSIIYLFILFLFSVSILFLILCIPGGDFLNRNMPYTNQTNNTPGHVIFIFFLLHLYSKCFN